MRENESDSAAQNSPPEAEAILLHGPITESERIENERKKYQKERDRKEDAYKDRQAAINEGQLTTNRRIAYYTLVLAILSVLGLVVSFLSSQAAKESANAAKSAAITADTTLKQIQSSGNDTKSQIERLIEQQQRTAAAMEGSLQQTVRALTFQTYSLQIEQRPYIVSGDIIFADAKGRTLVAPIKDRPLFVMVLFKNTGKSPALNNVLHRHLIFSSDRIRDIRGEPIDKGSIGTTIMQGAPPFRTTAVSLRDTFANETAKIEPGEIVNWNGTDQIILFGRNTYEDVFGKSYCDPFIFVYLDSGGWLYSPTITTEDDSFNFVINDLCPKIPSRN